jgi:hypothetical protein
MGMQRLYLEIILVTIGVLPVILSPEANWGEESKPFAIPAHSEPVEECEPFLNFGVLNLFRI